MATLTGIGYPWGTPSSLSSLQSQGSDNRLREGCKHSYFRLLLRGDMELDAESLPGSERTLYTTPLSLLVQTVAIVHHHYDLRALSLGHTSVPRGALPMNHNR